MKTLVITIKTDNTPNADRVINYPLNDFSGHGNIDYTIAPENKCTSAGYADTQTIFGSTMKDEFMYQIAISG